LRENKKKKRRGGLRGRGGGGGGLRERDHLGDPGLDESIMLKWICRKWDEGVWTGSG